MGHHLGGPPMSEDIGLTCVESDDAFVATFGVYDEGGGVRSLYLHPTAAVRLGAALLPICMGGQLAVLTEHPPLEGAEPLPLCGWLAPGGAALYLEAPVEAALIAPGVGPERVSQEFPASVLAWPEHALPESLGTRFALAMNDPRHAVILSRDPMVHRACLRALISDLAAGALDPSLPTPDIPEDALDEPLEPMAFTQWWSVRARERRRYRVLELEAFPGGRQAALSRSTWVADQRGGAWRANWTW